MTTRLASPKVEPTTESPRVFAAAAAVTTLVSGGLAVTPPAEPASVAIVVTVIALLGIPHGAVDHLVEQSRAASTAQTAFSSSRFHAAYVAAMGVYGLLWLVGPAVALVAFLLLSVHHFGQSDLAALRLGGRRQFVAQVSRGVFLVGLPLVAHVSAVAPVVERLSGSDPTSWAWLADHIGAWSVGLVAQHVVIGLALAPHLDRRTRVRESVTVVVLTALFVLADPLIGFAVYFGLWHSLHHLQVLARVLGDSDGRDGVGALTPSRLARLVAPRSAVSIGGLGVLVLGAHAVGGPDAILPVTFVFVSMLTLPHLFVVERMWRSEPAPERRAVRQP